MDTTAGLEPQRTVLDAGQEGTFVLSVRNDSEIVEDYALRVVGDLAEWATVEPTHVSVFPGHSATALVTLTPPRSSAVAAGEHPLGVHVRPVKRSENAAVPEGVVEVLPFFDTVAELSPQSTKSRKGGTYRVAVDNRGNAPVAVALAAKSASDGLGVALSETEQTMEPGTTWNSEVHTEPVKRLWRGAPVAYPFTVMVRPEEGAEVALAGSQYQAPILPTWTFKALLGVLALGAAIFLGVWTVAEDRFPPWARDSDPPSAPAGTEEPAEGPAEGPGGDPGEDPADGSEGDPGEDPADGSEEEPGEDPADGSEDDPGEDPADGSEEEPGGDPADPETVVLPSNMAGQPAGPLIDQILLQGVDVVRYDEPTSDFEPGTVVRTEPVGGSAVNLGDTVEMWIAIDPLPVVETFPVRTQVSAPDDQMAERFWPREPSEYSYNITSLVLENLQDDVGRFSIQLDDEILYEGPFDSVSDGAELIRQEGEAGDGPEVPDEVQIQDDFEAPNEMPELPLDPITVEAGQQLQFTTTCEQVGDAQVPQLTACNETFELDGAVIDAAAYG
ncbi:hypothetical protein ACH9DO_03235 [Kocuria sp. M1N1S27]|uniref:hypothetical protein n=1 Tax=Kocuria kalidii TaxID=3376283 RepID=UPI003792DE65